ncbi:methylmalonyl Co-A mutase-associated GTPase MeaB [Eisenibacter elegans]|uniref:methylmalonyl Co-A mutase-associated GTPase MeaB n=1 Tax=Eisenibacter elegans TaxID=997 RepID=UPI0004188413|nr:methylmalonyl Co-A mutase-associated GTPase MeaB [Eisenibacter elegans]
MSSPKRHSAQTYIDGILAQDRVLLSQAITVVESTLASDEALAQEILEQVLPHTGKAIRVGITGVPGVGKSTFIEALGTYLTDTLGHHLAVLAIDPSSQRSRGSILGDKTRMEQLGMNPRAYIRPSPAGKSLGGVARRTREAMLLCEAAGFEVLFIETVGVGQSETMVHGMVDFFLLLLLAGAGDELQGIKKGIMEMADLLAINKADGKNLAAARLAQLEYQNALHLFPPAASGWWPQVLTCSALEQSGIAELWEQVRAYEAHTQANGYWQQRRQAQNLDWMYRSISHKLESDFYDHPQVQTLLKALSKEVSEGLRSPSHAANELLQIYRRYTKI